MNSGVDRRRPPAIRRMTSGARRSELLLLALVLACGTEASSTDPPPTLQSRTLRIGAVEVWADIARRGAELTFALNLAERVEIVETADGELDYRWPGLIDATTLSLSVRCAGETLRRLRGPTGLLGYQVLGGSLQFNVEFAFDASGAGSPATFQVDLLYRDERGAFSVRI